jgi:hypothetical protein
MIHSLQRRPRRVQVYALARSRNDYELHACDIVQAFLQANKLPEGVNGRYFIQPPPGSPDANDQDVLYEVCRPYLATLLHLALSTRRYLAGPFGSTF